MELPQVTNKRLSAVRSSGTKPEVLVRKLLHGLGYRFRLHRRDLPGKPDIVLPKYKKVVFVNGCFWHQHKGCPMAPVPRRNPTYWEEKFRRNKRRDSTNYRKLQELDWDIMVVWECETQDLENLGKKLTAFIEGHTVKVPAQRTQNPTAIR